MIIISAGFDGHTTDPVGHLHLTVRRALCSALEAVAPIPSPCSPQTPDYAWIAEVLGSVCPRIISVLEGGYGVEADLGASVAAHVEVRRATASSGSGSHCPHAGILIPPTGACQSERCRREQRSGCCWCSGGGGSWGGRAQARTHR